MKLLFLTLMYEPDREREHKAKCRGSMPNAVNTFQKMLVEGLIENLGENDMKLINSYPFGIYKMSYDRLIFRKERFALRKGGNDINLGFINLPFIKQHNRKNNAYREIKRYIEENGGEKINILIYTLYSPYLKAVSNIKKKYANVEVTAIVTDLPGKYGILPAKGLLRQAKMKHSDIIMRNVGKIDKFVLLTEAMKYPLAVNGRPYIVVEGIAPDSAPAIEERKDGKRVFLYTGSFLEEFGVHTLARAFTELKDDNVELWLCGNATEDIVELSARDGRIKCLGYVTKAEIARYQSQADFLVNPRPNVGEYVKYSFPSKTMEYMSAGRPVLMYKLDGIPSEYDEYLNYFEGEGKDGLLNSLERILRADYGALLERAERGREFVLTKKNSSTQAGKILEFIDRK